MVAMPALDLFFVANATGCDGARIIRGRGSDKIGSHAF